MKDEKKLDEIQEMLDDWKKEKNPFQKLLIFLSKFRITVGITMHMILVNSAAIIQRIIHMQQESVIVGCHHCMVLFA